VEDGRLRSEELRDRLLVLIRINEKQRSIKKNIETHRAHLMLPVPAIQANMMRMNRTRMLHHPNLIYQHKIRKLRAEEEAVKRSKREVLVVDIRDSVNNAHIFGLVF